MTKVEDEAGEPDCASSRARPLERFEIADRPIEPDELDTRLKDLAIAPGAFAASSQNRAGVREPDGGLRLRQSSRDYARQLRGHVRAERHHLARFGLDETQHRMWIEMTTANLQHFRILERGQLHAFVAEKLERLHHDARQSREATSLTRKPIAHACGERVGERAQSTDPGDVHRTGRRGRVRF